MSRDLILTAAARLFQQRGYDRTSIAAIADAVGVTAPALYWHFSSKAEILFEFLRSTLREFTEGIERELTGIEDPVERLRVFAEGHTRAQLRQYDVSVLYGELIFSASQLSRSLLPEQLEELSLLQRQHLDACRSILKTGIAAGAFDVEDVTAAAFAVVNICEYVPQWFKPKGPLTIDDVARLHGEFALRLAGWSGAEGGRLRPTGAEAVRQ